MLALLKEGEKEPGEKAEGEMLERWGSPSMWAVGISLQLDEERGRGKQEERGARPPPPGGPLINAKDCLLSFEVKQHFSKVSGKV